MKRLSLIFTGGTIAMVRGKDDVLRPPADPKEFARAVPQIFEKHEISLNFALNKDSTDMVPEDWEKITAAIINEYKVNTPNGIIVVHGVDTICFTASAVAYALGPKLNFPVVFTGAQLPADRSHGDGLINLLRSAEIASSDGDFRVNEVMVFFNTKAFRACRAQKQDDKDFDALNSPAFPPLVQVKDPLEISFLKKNKSDYSEKPGYLNKFSTGIIPIPLSPGNDANIHMNILESDQCKGIILFSFGGHTIPTFKERHNYLPFITEAKKQKIPVLIASHYPTVTTKPDLYESGIRAQEAGAIPVSGYVLPALIAKFSWILAYTDHVDDFNKRNNTIETVLSEPYVGEIGDKIFSSQKVSKTMFELYEKMSNTN